MNGVFAPEGLKVQVRKNLKVYSYARVVYWLRVGSTGNRLVRQWSVGFNQRVGVPFVRSGLLMSLQYSHRTAHSGTAG